MHVTAEFSVLLCNSFSWRFLRKPSFARASDTTNMVWKARSCVAALRVTDHRDMLYLHDWIPLLAVSKQFVRDDAFVREIRAAVQSVRYHHDEILDSIYEHNMQIYDEMLSSVSCMDDPRDIPSAVDISGARCRRCYEGGADSSSDDEWSY